MEEFSERSSLGMFWAEDSSQCQGILLRSTLSMRTSKSKRARASRTPCICKSFQEKPEKAEKEKYCIMLRSGFTPLMGIIRGWTPVYELLHGIQLLHLGLLQQEVRRQT